MLQTTRSLVGLMVLAAGIVLLTERLGGATQTLNRVGQWWPLLLILLVVAHALTFVGPPLPHGASRGLPLAALGGLGVAGSALLLVTTNTIQPDVTPFIPPLLLILLGGVLATVRTSPDRRYQTWATASAVLRRTRLRTRARGLQLVTVRAILGQAALDLTDAQIHPRGAEVHATVIGGSILLRVPAGWKVTRENVREPTVSITVPPPPAPGLYSGDGRISITLTGIRGNLIVEWADTATTPGEV